MPSFVNLDVKLTGPFWTREGQFKRAMETAEDATAGMAEHDVKGRLGEVIKHPTGAYLNAVHAERRDDLRVVTDGGIAYGPWLESGRTRGPGGVPRVTRFKGYRSFLRTKNKVAKWLREQTEASLDKVISELNS